MSWEGNINAAYLSMLGRPATASDIAGKLNIYTNDSIQDKNQHLKDILNKVSSGGQGRVSAIRNAYVTFLGRVPTNAEVSQKANSTKSTQAIITGMAGEKEATAFKNSLTKGYVNQYSNQVKNGEGGNNRNQGYNSTAFNNGTRKSVWESNNSYWGLPGNGTNSNKAYYAALTNWNQVGRNTQGSNSRTIQSQQIIKLNNGGLAFSDSSRKLLSKGALATYNNLITGTNRSKGDNYTDILSNINDLDAGSRKAFMSGSKDIIDTVYRRDKIGSQWDPTKQAVNPPTGGFDAKYYLDNNGYVSTTWNRAKNNRIAGYNIPDLDITGRYANLDVYANADYSRRVVEDQTVRGNAAEDVGEYSEAYADLTDAEQQTYRDKLLGLTNESESGELSIDFTDKAKNNSRFENQVLSNLSGQELLEQDKFGTLTQDSLKFAADKLKEQQENEKTLDLYKNLPGFNEIYSANTSLANSLLGDSGIGGYLSMLGKDTEAIEESLEEQFAGVTGVPSNNSTIFNWQKWFDEEMVQRYKDMENITVEFDDTITDLNLDSATEKIQYEIQLTRMGIDPYDEDGNLIDKSVALETLEANNFQRIYEIDETFRTEFIENYLKPRFDQSKSMDEFISYMDVKEDEQNIFQTQSALDSLKTLASKQSRLLLQDIQDLPGNFDYNFYFNPDDENEAKQSTYDIQKQEVTEDWLNSIRNGNSIPPGQESVNGLNYTWNQWAYYYGIPTIKLKENETPEQAIARATDAEKEAFARLHYKVTGARREFDPAADILTQEKVDDYFVDTVIPALNDARLDLDSATFLNFVTPEQFADEVLRGIDPLENEEAWKEVLEMYGLDGTEAIDEVRDVIIEAVRTNSAQRIRESIKFLNEKKKTPTQKELGVNYIERASDKKDIDDETATELYKIFQSKGYSGTEDEFYDTFMPDADRSELDFLQKGLTGDFQLKDINTDDPFEALSSVGSFLGDGGNIFGTDSDSNNQDGNNTEDSYFNFFDDDDEDYASETGRSIIEGYSDFFK